MKDQKILFKGEKMRFTIERLAFQLIENYSMFQNTCIIGIADNGAILSDRIKAIIDELQPGHKAKYGKMDITFYRDDFRHNKGHLSASRNQIDFLVEGSKVILIDDVLYTGRTIQAALSAMQHYGRPDKVELLTLIDRRFNRQIPIKADYIGASIDALFEAYIDVRWKHIDGEDEVVLFPKKID